MGQPESQFSLLHLLCVFSVIAGLLAFTTNLGVYSVPLWLIAVLMWLILSPPRRSRRTHKDDEG